MTGIAHHNRVLKRARLRALELEPKLAGLLVPILDRAGAEAARAFQARVTDFLTAAIQARASSRLAGSGIELDPFLVDIAATLVAATPPGQPPQWASPAPDELIDVAALVATLRTKTDPVRLAVVETMMTEALAGVGIAFDATNPFVAKVLAQSGSQITHIAQTTQENVMKIIRESYEQGLSIPDTAAAIRAGMQAASIERATLIARTELAGTVNGGSLAATQIFAGATGDAYQKSWMTAPGAPHPRHEDYEGLDGQTVNLDEYFDVGGLSLMYPGDPDGDGGEVANCRCALQYVTAGGEATGIDVSAEE